MTDVVRAPDVEPSQRWMSVIRVWMDDGSEYYGYQHDPGSGPTVSSPEMIVRTLRSLADDIEDKFLTKVVRSVPLSEEGRSKPRGTLPQVFGGE